MYIVQCAVYTVHCTMYTVHCTLYTVHYTLYTVYCTLYTVHCILYTIHYTLYTVHCTLYTVHCTLYSGLLADSPSSDISRQMPGLGPWPGSCLPCLLQCLPASKCLTFSMSLSPYLPVSLSLPMSHPVISLPMLHPAISHLMSLLQVCPIVPSLCFVVKLSAVVEAHHQG